MLYKTIPEAVTSADLNASLSGQTLKVTCQGKTVISGTLFGACKTVKVGTQSVPGGSSIFWEGEKENQAVWDSAFSSSDMEVGDSHTALYRVCLVYFFPLRSEFTLISPFFFLIFLSFCR